MPRKQKLKVFRTAIGFHDAYVAAPSQKAALEAWGSHHNLFTRGIAEQVDDPELMREALENPGTIVKRVRGTAGAHIAALPEINRTKRKAVSSTADQGPAKASPPRVKKSITPPPKKPKPKRDALDEAEGDLAMLQKRQAVETKKLAQREKELERERRSLERSQSTELATQERKVEKLRSSYEREMQKWSA